MITIHGKGVSKGIAQGPLHFFRRAGGTVPASPAGEVEAELRRLSAAQARTVAQLEELAARCRETAGEDAALLFDTHAMLAEDEDFTECARSLIQQQHCGAEAAVSQAGAQLSALLAASEDDYLRARAADIRDVAHRILDNLTGTPPETMELDAPVILAADDLFPSETLLLDPAKLLGFVTREGSDTSHTAILSRTMGIPAVCGTGEALNPELDGRFCCLDGDAGLLVVDPDDAARREMDTRQEEQLRQARLLAAVKGLEDVAPDGRRLRLYCNISSPEEVAAVQENDGGGIGLFRSEFLFLRAHRWPTEEEQFAAYREVAAAMEGKRVVIRTLDVGGDKQADYLGLERETNPALGLRGVRFCLSRPQVFRTQLRAIYRASAYGDLALMFPMIASVWEVRACRDLCREVMAELDREGLPYNSNLEVGIMIETPAAALMADQLAREADFFSVGTNDLAQYTLACDRQAGGLDRFFDPRHPAVLRAVQMAANAAHAAHIPIGICGELAAEPDLLPVFLDMGIDVLSVSPAALLPLRAALRQGPTPGL